MPLEVILFEVIPLSFLFFIPLFWHTWNPGNNSLSQHHSPRTSPFPQAQLGIFFQTPNRSKRCPRGAVSFFCPVIFPPLCALLAPPFLPSNRLRQNSSPPRLVKWDPEISWATGLEAGSRHAPFSLDAPPFSFLLPLPARTVFSHAPFFAGLVGQSLILPPRKQALLFPPFPSPSGTLPSLLEL